MNVCITIDLDCDGQNNRYFEIQNTSFGYAEALREFCKVSPPCTLFARIDNQVDNLNIAEDCLVSGDIGWHPHLFHFDSFWEQVTSENQMVEQLDYHYPTNMSCMRIGSCQGGNKVAKWIDSKGFKIDSSAMPGCRRQDSIRHYNWSQCLGVPYHPSKDNYQVSGEDNYRFLEIPLTTLKTQACYDKDPKLRVLNPSYKTEIFQPAVMAHQFSDLIIIGSHGEELKEGYSDDLYEYGTTNYMKNLEFLRSHLDAEFTTLDHWRRTRTSRTQQTNGSSD